MISRFSLLMLTPTRVFSFWTKSLIKKEVAYRWKIRYDGRYVNLFENERIPSKTVS